MTAVLCVTSARCTPCSQTVSEWRKPTSSFTKWGVCTHHKE